MEGEAAPKRHDLIDSLRAIALAGVIVMNMMTFSGLAYLTPEMRSEMLGTADQLAWAFLRIFVDGKALAAFSFMFGFSFSIILEKALSAGESSATRFIRRLATLFLIGLFNALFLFWADILMAYALLGLILPLAARLPTRAITGMAVGLVLAGPAALAIGGYAKPAPVPRGHLDSLDAYASTQIPDTLSQNLHMVLHASEGAESMLLLRLFTLSGLFLLGLAAGRSGVLLALTGNRARLLRLGMLAMLTGLAMKLALRFAFEAEGVWALLNLQAPIMALGYLMLVGAALTVPAASVLRRLLAPLGRMTLTGYLMSAVLGQLVFYGWGFGLIGQLGTLATLAVAAGIYALLVVFAQLWLRQFRLGPWEWLWRSLASLKPLSLAGSGLVR